MISHRLSAVGFLVVAFLATSSGSGARAEMQDMPVAKLQWLDKATARTATFEAPVGETIQHGPLYIRAQACRKAPPIEQPESAVFLQIWEVNRKTDEPEWVFSGWMFASSPALSPMDHPIYDVWVLDCDAGEGADLQTESAPSPENQNADEQSAGAPEDHQE